ncbi:hypothetical protein KI688_001564 [Linnemannia hyalina]|uniref:Uncharacterized protein n=1 Tax=Linnemannia hyalina TaxID=64524 RepID=A0A9P8BSA0_9FUNG|nr:hypothetical protein KI688_001564 [Linnemannia hyalina]
MSRETTAIDATPSLQSPEQQSNTMGYMSVTSVPGSFTIPFRTIPPVKEAVKSLPAVKIDNTQPTPRSNDHFCFSSPTTAATTRRKTLESDHMPMLESELESEIESEAET